MAGILRRFTKFIFGEGEEEELNALINKVEQYKCVHTRLYCFHTESATKMSIYTKAKASLVWNDSTGKFFVCLENLCDDDDEDEDEENQIFLPLIKDLNWNLDESKNDDDDFAIKHFFDYTKQKDLKNVGGGRYEVNFTTDAKTDEIENFENYINDILDFVEKITPAEEAKESTQADEEEKKEFSDSLFEGKGTLFQYNNEEDKNEVVEENVKFLVQKLEGDFKYAFTVIVEDVGEILIQTHVHEGTQASINSSSGVIMWIHDTFTSGDEDLNAFVFYFTNKGEKDIDILSKAVSKCIFECQRKVSIEDNVKEEDMSWMADAYVEDLREEEDKSEYNDEDEEYQGIDESYKDMIMEDDQEYDNKDFLQAHTYDRAFVVRGEGFGVYGTDNDSGLSYCGDIPILNEYSGAPAENLMLHDNENKLLFIDPQEKNLIK